MVNMGVEFHSIDEDGNQRVHFESIATPCIWNDRCISCWILFFWLYMVENSDSHPFIYYMYVLNSLNGQWTDTVV